MSVRLDTTIVAHDFDQPQISIIVPMHNAQNYIKETIESVLSQSFFDFELILIDDASVDSTIQLVHQYNDPRIKLLRCKKNEGAGAARNKGIDFSKGRFIAFLDADDLWAENKLELQYNFMIEKRLAACYTKYDIVDQYGKAYSSCGHIPKIATYYSILMRNYIRTSSFMYDSRCISKDITFSGIRKRQDMLFFLDVIKRSSAVRLLPHKLCSYRTHLDSISASKISLIPYQWQAYRVEEKLPIITCSFLLFSWFILAGFLTTKRRIKNYIAR